MPEFSLPDLPTLPASLRDQIESAAMPDLQAGNRQSELADWIQGNDLLGFTSKPSHPAMAAACRSGMWLLAGELDRSHTISQDIGAAEGSFWHGIMHRREGDFGNAKYWFRQTGSHPALAVIGEQTAHQGLSEQLACFEQGVLDPFAFVDACQRAVVGREASLADACRTLQWLEWQALFAHCVAYAWPA